MNTVEFTSFLDSRGYRCQSARNMLAFAAGWIMEMEVETRTGAAAGARSADRKTYRNGYRERAWDTPAGRIDLDIPKLR